MKKEGKKASLSKQEAYLKLCNFCAYQERTQQEAREKLQELEVNSDDTEELISKLITENFINEERFSKTYAGGKFRVKKWGKIKIQLYLKQKGLSEYCIKKGLQEIQEDDYLETLKALAEEKLRTEKEKDIFKRKHKISNFLIQKGFEPALVWEVLKGMEDE